MGNEDNLFSDFIKGLDINLSDKGLEPPQIEHIEDDVEELDGHVLKVTFDLYLFMNHTQQRYFMLSSNQKMQNVGRMSLKDAILKFNSKARRKKG